ncbi:MAG: leucine-rich repeat domain-containing protein [Bacteroidales bacterium]|nr:leucine-rich repeat domain-containing protein [Bacteroidales bacterium]
MKLFKSLSTLRQFRTLIVAAVTWFSMLPAWSQDYLCFTAVNDNYVSLVKNQQANSVYVEYSYDKVTWNTMRDDYGSDYVSLPAGQPVYFRAGGYEYVNKYYGRYVTTNNAFAKNCSFEEAQRSNQYKDRLTGDFWYFEFYYSNQVEVSGNIMSLLDQEWYNKNITSVPDYAFCGLFYNCSEILSAPELPATTLGKYCYYGMFFNCDYLTAAPELPATTLKDYCYAYMFAGGSSLCSMDVSFTAWHDNATKEWARMNYVGRSRDGKINYVSTFSSVGVFSCPSSLYTNYNTFYGESLIPTGWTISSLNNDCLRFSWRGFYEENGSTWVMGEEFSANISLQKKNSPDAVNLEYSKDGKKWYPFVTNGTTETVNLVCGQVLYIRADEDGNDTFSKDLSNYYYFQVNLLYNKGQVNNLDKYKGVIEIGGNVMSLLDPDYLRMDVPDYAFCNLFGGPKGGSVQGVFSAPSLPAVELGRSCYYRMFRGCTYLNSAPTLPATTEDLTESSSVGCYNYMFQNCTNLEYLNVGFDSWTIGSDSISKGWVSGVSTTSGTFSCPDGLLTNTDDDYHISRVPENWNNSSSEVGTVDDENDYLCLEVETVVGTVRLNRSSSSLTNLSGLQYSLDKKTWNTYTWAGNNGKVITLNKQDGNYRVYFRSNNDKGLCSTSASSYYNFELSGTFNASGNVMSLVQQDCQLYRVSDFMFYKLFAGCASLKGTPTMPATSLGESCYDRMYQGCVLLSSAPELPATVMQKNCYRCMFEGCSKLTAVSTLPSTALAEGCYFQMFYKCSSLASAPALPASVLATNCYNHMFDGCSSLKYISVGFSAWPDWWKSDTTWVANVSTSGVFMCPGDMASAASLDVASYFGSGRIPYDTNNRWKVVDNSSVGLYFEARRNGSTITLNQNGEPKAVKLVYSQNDGVSWSDYTIGTSISVNKAERVYFKAGDIDNVVDATNATFSGPETSNYFKFSMTGSFDAKGNIMSLLDAKCEETKLGDYAFYRLFDGCTKLKSAPLLPAITLGVGCYYKMFNNNTSLTEAPTLPAMEMKDLCYFMMFRNCTSLSSAPELPALSLASYCYQQMFQNNTSLKVAPTLPATDLKPNCYNGMFSGCSSLQYMNVKFTSWHSDATEDWVSDNGSNIFPTSGIFMCPDELPHEINQSTSNYTTSRIPKADEDGKRWIVNEAAMYFTADNSPATIALNKVGSPTAVTLKYSLDNALTWTDLTFGSSITVEKGKSIYIKAKGDFTGFSTSTNDYYQFVINNGSMSVHGSLLALINQTASLSTLSNQKIPAYCFYNLFKDCTGLTNVPDLPSAEMGNYAYANMFSGCTSLTEVDELSMETLSEGCYSGMFQGCTSLTTAPALPATTLATNCYSGMFQNCTKLSCAPELPATTLESGCYNNIFNGCTSMNEIAVGFTSWVDGSSNACTTDWVAGVANEGVFTCPTTLDVSTYGSSRVPKDYSNKWNINPDFLAFKCVGSNSVTIALNKVGSPEDVALVYSNGSKTNWTTYTVGSTVTVEAGKSVYFKAKDENRGSNYQYCFSKDDENYYQFSIVSSEDGSVEASGNVGYLLSRSVNSIIPPAYGFYRLFKDCTALSTGPEVSASNQQMSAHAYESMFEGCSNMTVGPSSILSNGLAESCYESMFEGCEALTTAPTLPVNQGRATACYKGMFKGCKSLVNNIPSTLDAGWNLAESCFESMFEGCEALTTTPTLPTSNLVDRCYAAMFKGCKSLTSDNIPELPARDLKESCYESMFEDCIGLISPAVQYNPTTWNAFTLDVACFKNMYKGCTSLTSTPNTFNNDLKESCFEGMFEGCASLAKAPSMSQTTMATRCYYRMFAGCTSLTAAPELPAKKDALASECYAYMFNGCSSLRYMDVAFSEWRDDLNATTDWVDGVAQSGTFMCPDGLDKIYDKSHIPFSTTYMWSVEDNGDYLCFTSVNGGSNEDLQFVKIGNPNQLSYRYSTDKKNWISVTGGVWTQLMGNVPAGYTVYIKIGENSLSKDAENYWQFTGSATVKVSGNIMSLLDPAMEQEDVPDYSFYKVFSGLTNLVDVSGLTLPATEVGDYAYANMFDGCSTLQGSETDAPELPATTLGDYCYQNLFKDWTALVNAPELPATTLATGCYSNLYNGCTSLANVPALPATTLVSNCYENLFYNCSSLDSIEVAFTKWAPEGVTDATAGWVSGVANSGSFVCPWALAQDAIASANYVVANAYGSDMIPKDNDNRWLILTKTEMSMDYAAGLLNISGENSPIYYSTDASLSAANLIGTCVEDVSTSVDQNSWLDAAVSLDSVTYYALSGAAGDINGLPVQPTVNSLTIYRYPKKIGMCIADNEERIKNSLYYANKVSSSTYPVEIFIPDGIYTLDKTYEVGDYISVIGESDNTIVQSSGDDGVFKITGDNVYMQDLNMENTASGSPAFTNKNATTTLYVTSGLSYIEAVGGLQKVRTTAAWDRDDTSVQAEVISATVNGSTVSVTEVTSTSTNRFLTRVGDATSGYKYSFGANVDFTLLESIENEPVTIRTANSRGGFGNAYTPITISNSGTEYDKLTITLNSKGFSSFSYEDADVAQLQVIGASVYSGIWRDDVVYLNRLNQYDVVPSGVGVVLFGLPNSTVKLYPVNEGIDTTPYEELVAAARVGATTGAVGMTGTCNNTIQGSSDKYYYGLSGNSFCKLKSTGYIKPNKSYFDLTDFKLTSTNAASYRVVFGWWADDIEFESDVTTITTLEDVEKDDDNVFNLSGMKTQDQKGLVVKNNKVILVK